MLNQVVLTGNLGADPEIFYRSRAIRSPLSISPSSHPRKKKPAGSSAYRLESSLKSQNVTFTREPASLCRHPGSKQMELG